MNLTVAAPATPAARILAEYRSAFESIGAADVRAAGPDEVRVSFGPDKYRGDVPAQAARALLNPSIDGVRLIVENADRQPVTDQLTTLRRVSLAAEELPRVSKINEGYVDGTLEVVVRSDRAKVYLDRLLQDEVRTENYGTSPIAFTVDRG